MAKVTAKENFLKLANGEMPYYVPFYSLMGGIDSGILDFILGTQQTTAYQKRILPL